MVAQIQGSAMKIINPASASGKAPKIDRPEAAAKPFEEVLAQSPRKSPQKSEVAAAESDDVQPSVEQEQADTTAKAEKAEKAGKKPNKKEAANKEMVESAQDELSPETLETQDADTADPTLCKLELQEQQVAVADPAMPEEAPEETDDSQGVEDATGSEPVAAATEQLVNVVAAPVAQVSSAASASETDALPQDLPETELLQTRRGENRPVVEPVGKTEQPQSDDSSEPSRHSDSPSQATVSNAAPAQPAQPARPAEPARKTESGSVGAASNRPEVEPTIMPPTPSGTRPATPATAAIPAAPQPGLQHAFVEVNHPQIVQTISGQLLPKGGTVQIRLDPPELGAMQITIRIQDNMVSASFETSSADATRLLSHSLAQLKHTLESQGVSVDRLQVQQAPRNERARGDEQQQSQQQQHAQDDSARQEQQRREMMQRLWRRLANGADPLDVLG